MTELREHTSLRVGGPAKNFVTVGTEPEIIAAIEAAHGGPLLILGEGTNLLVSDAGFEGTVIHISNNQLKSEVDACSGATLSIGAGENWDAFVAMTLSRGFAGLETLSGIPGSVGAAPIQNIGAYGHEVAEFITRVRTFDVEQRALKTFTNSECEFGYRSSIFKRHPGRYVVLEVQFQLRRGEMTTEISYPELAKRLGVEVGQKVMTDRARDAVLQLRASKGMLLNDADHDTWSAGSFFINPILPAGSKVPEGAAQWPTESGAVKISAAWLIENSGVTKGQSHGGARISSKHVLAITNAGSAKASDIATLARLVQDSVYMKFGIKLEPEVNLVGLSL